MWSVMSAAGREEFLAGVHVGVLSAAVGTTGRTLAVPVWYSYQPGGLLTVLTGRRSRKAGAIRAAGRFALCVQDDSPPYRYVTVEGPVVSEEELDPAERLAMARRYLGSPGGDQYVADNPDPRARERGVPDASRALAQPGSGHGTSGSVARASQPRGTRSGQAPDGESGKRLAAASVAECGRRQPGTRYGLAPDRRIRRA
jgi:hypothetical protein